LGRPWPDADSAIRRLVAGSHLIFYREETTRLVILRVLDGRMDVEAELLK
jgi:plasmid stabilization system protein ParE